MILELFVTNHKLFVKPRTETLGLIRTSLDLFWPVWRIILTCNILSNSWVTIFLICLEFCLAQNNCFFSLIIVYIFVSNRQK